jgi:hypothetical protein
MDGYQLSLEFKNGLLYLHYRKPMYNEISLLPQIIMTLAVTWDPRLYDDINDDIDQFYDPLEDTAENKYHFDQHREYQHCTVATITIDPEEKIVDAIEYNDFDDIFDDFLDLL